MKFEYSAGGVVYKREKNAEINILISQHSFHHGWVFPKGIIGDASAGSKSHSTLRDEPSGSDSKSSLQVGLEQANETKEEAAVREVKEETGIDADIIQSLEPVSYWYVFEGEKIKKTVYYFVMKHLGGNFDDRDHEMEQVEWVPIEKVFDKLTYPSDKKVFEEAKGIIQRLVTSV